MLTTVNLVSLGIVAALMTVVWLLSIRVRNAAIVDVAWGSGFVAIAWGAVVTNGRFDTPSLILALLTTVWGLRLSIYLAWRNIGKPEDYRYQAMRQHHGHKFWWRSLLTVFALQGAIMWIVSLPLQIGISQAEQWSRVATAGAALWLVGFSFETIGDLQLAIFKSNPNNRGQVLDQGLWRYTRHPNYFGDFLVWWGLFFVSTGIGEGWWTVLSPLIMSFLLMRVSGVRLLENALHKRLDRYSEYTQRTSPFFPLPPKKS